MDWTTSYCWAGGRNGRRTVLEETRNCCWKTTDSTNNCCSTKNELLLEDELGEELLVQELDDQLLELLGYQLLLDKDSAMSRKPSHVPRMLL